MKNLNLNNTKIIFFIIGIIHYIIGFLLTEKFNVDFSISQKIYYFLSKIIAFIIIILFWQTIPIIVKNYTNIKSYINWFLFYLIINIIILILTFPGCYIENLYSYLQGLIYSGDLAEHYLYTLDIIVAQHIIPTFWGVILFNIIIYSIIFSYCINGIKQHISQRFFYLVLILFCFPAILFFNEISTRHVFAVYLNILIFSFILFNINKNYNNKIITIAFAIISSCLVSFRTEYIPMLLIIPLLVLFLNIFNKKKFILYIIIFLISLTGLYSINNQNNAFYKLHNLSFLYAKYIKYENLDVKKEKEYNLFKKVYVEIDKINSEENRLAFQETIGTNNKELNDKVSKVILKKIIKYPYSFFTYGLRENINQKGESASIIMNMGYNKYKDPDSYEKCKYKNLFNNAQKEKIISYLVYGTNNYNSNKFFKYFYNLKINLFVLSLLLFYGIIKKRIFYFLFSLNWFLIFIILMIFEPFYFYFYNYALVFTSWLFFIILIIQFLEYQFKKVKP